MGKLSLHQLIGEVNRSTKGVSALERLGKAVQLGHELAALSDDLTGHFVEQAKKSGASWTEVGQILGVTKQAAHQRFFVPGSAEVTKKGRRFSRFNDPAREAIEVAKAEASAMNHDYLGTEHLLLGVIGVPDSAGAKALKALGITRKAVHPMVGEVVGQGNSPISGNPPFTPRSRKVLELALKEALKLGHNYIGTEHMVLALVAEGGGVAPQILRQLGAEPGVRAKVLEILTGSSR